MKGFPKWINTEKDWENLLGMKEYKKEALKRLKEIYETNDEKVTKTTMKNIFVTAVSNKEHLKEGIVAKETYNIFKNNNNQISENAKIVNIQEIGQGKKIWFLEDESENQRYAIIETKINLQIKKEQQIEIDNPFPLHRRWFKNKEELKNLIDSQQSKNII